MIGSKVDQAPLVELDEVAVGYGPRPVVRGVSLRVARGESLALLGPSGSGKTSLLHVVAGFMEPIAGEVRIDGRRVAGGGELVPPEQRSVGMVFQHYALWPHLTALETVAYPLRRRGRSRSEAMEGARLLLERMSIGHLADRRPAALSGGEQQRVGLARALARAPAVFLLDEPMAHLDTTLRGALEEELAERGPRAGAATLYATHDVGEALAVADQVALLRDGRVVQVGTPVQVYEEPADRWAAELTGPASVLEVVVRAAGSGSASVQVGAATVSVICPTGVVEGARLEVLVRPDWLTIGSGELPAVVRTVRYRGAHADYRLETPAGTLVAREAGAPRLAPGERTAWSLRRVWPLSLAGPPEAMEATPLG